MRQAVIVHLLFICSFICSAGKVYGKKQESVELITVRVYVCVSIARLGLATIQLHSHTIALCVLYEE